MSHIIIEHFHGAASRVPVTATACTMRTTGFNVVIASQWTRPDETDRGIQWARQTFASLRPFLPRRGTSITWNTTLTPPPQWRTVRTSSV